MKILFVNKYVSIEGGAEYYINALSRRLRDMGHECSIIQSWTDAEARGFETTYSVEDIWKNELYIADSTRREIERIISKERPDVIYLHAVENGDAIDCFSGAARTVRYIHDYKTVDPDGKMLLHDPLEVSRYPLSLSCFLRAYTRRAMPRNPIKGMKAYLRSRKALGASKRLGKVIVASGYMKDVLGMNGVDLGRIEVLPYFVDRGDVTIAAGSGSGRILYCGRIAEGKGLEVLLEVLSRSNSDFYLDIVGTGPQEEECRKRASELGILDKVIFHGWVAHEKLASFYEKSRFLVIPSIWPEPFGICGIEAAFFGKPSVAFDVGGISDWLIDGNTGFLIEPYDKEKMSEKIEFLLKNPGKTEELGHNAQKNAIEKYSSEVHLKRLLEIFGEL
ncbi:MAG: glycosyltransferase family 4 protein [Candidatus Tantalella remota]|nr:glycosyltransferase family 4 protein [Candidatus Tantalella remota]